jgi:F0F1-type ATP synthase membrane subunit b/b'
MEQTLQALGGLMQKAVPTILILILLFWYFRAMLFNPLGRILKEREELTEGARRAAEKSLKLAEAKQQKFAEARAEVYKFQEDTRRKWLEEQAAQVADSKLRSEAAVRKAKDEIAAEAATARGNLTDSSAGLAQDIVAMILDRRVGGTK